MALLPYVDEDQTLDSVRAELNQGVKRNIALMMANSPHAFLRSRALGRALMREVSLDPKLRELAILRTAQLTGCEYVWREHAQIAADAGVSSQQISALATWRDEAQCFSPTERLVIALANEVTTEVKGSPDKVRTLEKDIGADDLVSLMFAIGFWGLVGRLVETLEVDFEIGSEDFAAPAGSLRRD